MRCINNVIRLFLKPMIFIKGILSQQQGAGLIIVSAGMVAILGMVALVTDVGLTYIQKQKLSNAVDAAVLAAVQDITVSEQNAKATALEYIEKNGFDEEDVVITVSSSMRTVQIEAKEQVDFFFARILGFDNTLVDAKAKAAAFPVTGMTGVRPFAVEDFPFQYGEQYVLKHGVEEGYHGNFGPVALGATGASNYRNNIKYGHTGKLKVGDWVDTETGNMPNPTEEGVDYLMNQCNHAPRCTIAQYDDSCARIIPIPIVDSLDVDGRSSVQVVGFAMFLLEGTSDSGGHMQVIGRFIKSMTTGDSGIGGRDYGLYAVKLIE
ncbi:MAG: pilus assembly protein TadG-related protein [Clostridia bacterium]